MTTAKTFDCPSCGAPLTPHVGQTEIKCEFCGNVVIVPAELRTQLPPPQPVLPSQPQVYILETPPQVIYEQQAPAPVRPIRRRRRSGCGCFVSLLMFLTIIGFGVAATRPVLVARLISDVRAAAASFSGSPQIISFTAIPNIVSAGGTVTVVWITNGDSVSLSRTSNKGTQVISSLTAAGDHAFTVAPDETGEITFRLTVAKNGQEETGRATASIRRR